MKLIEDGGRLVFLCHYPMASWQMMERGSILVYGHIHKNTKDDVYEYISKKKNAYNAGCMINGYEPATLDELIVNNFRFHDAVRRGLPFDGRKM